MLVEPNDWEREPTQELTDTEQAYLAFYEAVTEAYAQRRSDWYKLTPQPQNWLVFGAGLSGVSFGWVFHNGPEFAVELYIDTGDKERNTAIYQILKDDKDEIHANLGEHLVWQRLPEKRACRIKLPRDIPERLQTLSDEEQQELVDWGMEKMDQFQSEFESRIRHVESRID